MPKLEIEFEDLETLEHFRSWLASPGEQFYFDAFSIYMTDRGHPNKTIKFLYRAGPHLIRTKVETLDE